MAVNFWNLPGPTHFVDAIVDDLARGRHAASVLPQWRCEEPQFADDLANALATRLGHAGADVSTVFADQAGPAAWVQLLGEALYCHGLPATVPDLLTHPDVRGRTVVVQATLVAEPLAKALPGFLERLTTESRARSMDQRLTLVVVTGRQGLPAFSGGDVDEVHFATHWWWNRLSRWDTAVYLGYRPGRRGGHRVVQEVIVEMIVEVARWDLNLALRLHDEWTGDVGRLRGLLPSAIAPLTPGVFERSAPPAREVAAWDCGLVEGWHDTSTVHSRCLSEERDLAARLWAAQARVLLPWIESRRRTVEKRTRLALGDERFLAALQTFEPPLESGAPVEIGPLCRIISIRLGRSQAALLDVATQLRNARNCLAHLQPLPLTQIESLVESCHAY